MASNDNTPENTPGGGDVPDGSASTQPDTASAAPPAKKAAKRAPRKAAKKAAGPVAPADAPAAGPADEGEAPVEADKPVKKAAKRAPRKAAKQAAAATSPEQAAPDHAAPEATAVASEPARGAEVEGGRVAEPATAPTAPAFGVLFKPPTEVAPRRARSAVTEVQPSRPEDTGSDTGASADAQQEPGADHEDHDDHDTEGGRRRRRRGGKGRRGRSSGEGAGAEDGSQDQPRGSEGAVAAAAERADQPDKDQATAKDHPGETRESAEGEGEDESADEGGQGRKRTRRRRRGGDGEDGGATVTKVREPRKARDEVTSVKGSTRLEAKKQRRREGREAGRRRTIITEAEFLARRESVERVMVVRHKDERTQIGVLEDGVLVEHYVSQENSGSAQSLAGNVFLGRVQNVLPSMEAAFIDIGKGRNAVLYAGEVNWDAAGLDNQPKRIEHALKSGESVLVQVTKDPIGHKGARLTSQVSLPGRYLVYVPGNAMTGISRKLPDTERSRLKKILREIVPDNAGVIVRTAAEGASEDELRADVERLTKAWEGIQARAKSASAPSLLHGEPDLTVRVVRDVFNEDFSQLVIAGDEAWSTVSDYLTTVAPDLADRASKWTGSDDLFSHYRVDEQIAKAMDRKVWLPSGGSLVIDRTEAMTVVDVNTGKFVGSGGNLEETVTKNNIEAAEEIVRQLRLRDIGGIIVIDFIDMVLESNRDLVVRRLLECLGRDRTKHQVAEVTSLGLVQMTRKRVGAGLIEVFSENCEHCNGRGIIVHADPVDKQSGNGGDHGSGRGARGRRNKGGGGSSGSSGGNSGNGGRHGDGQDSPAPEHKSPEGPTPAQIAAAAHAAALQAATAGGEPEPVAAQPAVEQAAAPETPAAEPVTAPSARQATAAAPVPDTVGPVGGSTAAAPTTGRPRRKRGRVVAPAGPPGATSPSTAPAGATVEDGANA